MNTRTFTLSEMADILARAADRDEDYAVYVHRRLREFQRNRSLPWASYSGQGRTASAVFDERAIFLCAMVLHLSDAPLRFNLGEQIDFIEMASNAKADGVIGITTPIKGIRAQERWSLLISVWRNYAPDAPAIILRGSWLRDGKPTHSAKVDETLELLGKPMLARIEIPLNLIFAPIIAILDAEA